MIGVDARQLGEAEPPRLHFPAFEKHTNPDDGLAVLGKVCGEGWEFDHDAGACDARHHHVVPQGVVRGVFGLAGDDDFIADL